MVFTLAFRTQLYTARISKKEYNVSNELANYMTMVFDPSASVVAASMRETYAHYKEVGAEMSGGEDYDARLARMDIELEAVLSNRSMTFVELLDAIAVRYS